MHRLFFWGSLVVFILSIGMMIQRANLVSNLERNTDSYLVLAARSVDATEINGYLVKYQTGLQTHGLTEGSSALVFKQPYEDLAEHLNVVNQLITQSAMLAEVDRKSDAYALQLGVISSKLSTVPGLASNVIVRDYPWLNALIIAICFAISLVILGWYVLMLGEDDISLSDLSIGPSTWKLRRVA